MSTGGLMDGFYSLSDDINKINRGADSDTQEGAVSDLTDELTLDMDDDELIALKTKWESNWDEYDKEINQVQKENEQYYLGNQYPGFNYKPTERPLTDNLIFESLETYLPMATKNNPEPVVEGDGTDQGSEQADITQKYLVHLADKLHMKMKIKRVAKYWSLYLLGAAKIGWSYADNELTLNVPRPQKLILDPDSTINDDMEYEGAYIGEVRKDTADVLLQRFAKKKVAQSGIQEAGTEPDEAYEDEVYKAIFDECKGKFGTELQYQEWWTPKYVFWTLKKNVLGKYKNPHWNYKGIPQNIITPDGQTQQQQSAPHNHFSQPKMPYVFLSIFNLGKRPHDDTSLVGQNLAKQDIINKRQRQIDKNVDWMNGGWAVSGERSGLTRDEASNAVDAARKGGGIWVPQGDIGAAIQRMTGEGLPADVFAHLNDLRQELRNSFGTSGASPASMREDETVGGKILMKTMDGDRIGGGISEYLEIFSSQIFNWFIQMIYVYYTEPHRATIVGENMAQESVQLEAQQITTDLTVGVKSGSLIPKDSMTQANQAVDLAERGLIDPLTLFQKLQYGNPKESTERILLFKGNLPGYVQKYFPDLAQLFQPQAPPEKLPSESISYSDLSPEAQAQMLAKVGIKADPAQLAIHQVASEVIKHASKPERPEVVPAAKAQIKEANTPDQIK